MQFFKFWEYFPSFYLRFQDGALLSIYVHMNIATDRVREQLDADKNSTPYPIYPEEPGLMEKYPGIDPLGQYTKAEMSLAYRLEQESKFITRSLGLLTQRLIYAKLG